MDSKELVMKKMTEAGKPLKAGEVADLTGLDKNSVEKVFKELKKEDRIVSPIRCYWEPKK